MTVQDLHVPLQPSDLTSSRRAAVVFGASRGLGFASAQALAHSGSDVVISARDDRVLADQAEAIDSEGRVLPIGADLLQTGAAAEVIRSAHSVFGRLDTVVVNGGGPKIGDFAELDLQDWTDAYRLVLMPAIEAIAAAAEVMKRQRHGRIIVIGSSSVRAPIRSLTLSNVLRPALNGLVKTLAVEFASSAITVNMVAPGRFDTERVRSIDQARADRSNSSYEAQRTASESSIPMGRYGRPEEIGAVVAFLASDAASYVTGQTILVDGASVATLP